MMTPGCELQGAYSFFPLLLYFILSFFEDPRLRTFLSAVLVMIFSLVSSPYFTLGYFYQGVHFFILSCAAGFLFQRGWRIKPDAHPFQKNFIKYRDCRMLFVNPLTLLSAGACLDPRFLCLRVRLGGTQGRFNNILNFKGYFNTFGKGFADAFLFWGTSLDYHHSEWGVSWLFIGGSTLYCLWQA